MKQGLPAVGAEGGYGGAEDGGAGVFGEEFDGVVLEGAHLHHRLQQFPQQTLIEEADVEAGVVEASGAAEVYGGGGGGGEGAVPEFDEVAAAGVAGFGGGEDFFRLHVEEAEAHGAYPHVADQSPVVRQCEPRFIGAKQVQSPSSRGYSGDDRAVGVE